MNTHENEWDKGAQDVAEAAIRALGENPDRLLGALAVIQVQTTWLGMTRELVNASSPDAPAEEVAAALAESLAYVGRALEARLTPLVSPDVQHEFQGRLAANIVNRMLEHVEVAS